ncbi:MAG: tetratricopeptide repeat protein [Alphaproteobacteria bacterium]|nr:tetratricopeptide repeat protein [Alphaproteobacteria bacterium]
MLADRYGNPTSTASRAALDHYDAALESIRLYRGDPIAALDAALEEDPQFSAAWAARAGLFAQATDKAFAGEIARNLKSGAQGRMTPREALHLDAARAWAEGRYAEGAALYARCAQEHPRDLLALQFAHVACFFLGMQHELRDWPLQALRAFRRGDDGYGPLLGMVAFGFEECGDYERADAMGREAVALDGRDGWAVHAVAHVNEMRGDTDAGIPWLAGAADTWAPDSGFAYHNWWHLALLHLDREDFAAALALYDDKIRPNPDGDIVLELVDASALLWRLHLLGAETGDRFAKLADAWARTRDDAIYAFNDLHAIMALLGAGRMVDAERTLSAVRRAAAGDGDNAFMSRSVGVPLAEGFIAFGAGRFEESAAKILGARGLAQRFGGSHAQRDILTLTALEAALRGGLRDTAEAIAFERTTHKPHSPWARTLARRAQNLAPPRA